MSIGNRKTLTRAAILLLASALAVAPGLAETPKGSDSYVDYSAPLRASGGPDAFGYTWFDQDEAECNFSFNDISGTGTQLTFTASGTFPADDDGGADVTLAAPIDFYGTSVTDVVVSTNGYIAMGATLATENGGDFSEDCPLPAAPDNTPAVPSRLSPYHNDLAGDGTGGTAWVEYFASCPRASEAGAEDCTIVQWENWGFFNGTVGYDLQVVMYHQSGLFVYQYQDPNAQLDASSTAIGLQNFDATDALQIGCDTLGAISDGSALCVYNPSCATPDCLAPSVPPTDIPTQGPLSLLLLALALAAGGGIVLARRRA
ncbi:MAG: hypothetical protein AAGN66_19025 [Acidobacteriota bacterium]